jgi:hypothetical protein
MRHRAVPVQLAAIALAVATGWVVASGVRASGGTRQQQITRLTARSADQRALAIYAMQGLAQSGACWDAVASARGRADVVRDRVRTLGLPARGPRARVGALLRRERELVDRLDEFASDAEVEESRVLDQFGDRYSAGAVAVARRDLAGAVAGVHAQTRHWRRAIDLQRSGPIAASGSALAQSEFAAADTAGAGASAALDRLSNDWAVVVHLLRVESDDTRSELSTSQ